MEGDGTKRHGVQPQVAQGADEPIVDGVPSCTFASTSMRESLVAHRGGEAVGEVRNDFRCSASRPPLRWIGRPNGDGWDVTTGHGGRCQRRAHQWP